MFFQTPHITAGILRRAHIVLSAEKVPAKSGIKKWRSPMRALQIAATAASVIFGAFPCLAQDDVKLPRTDAHEYINEIDGLRYFATETVLGAGGTIVLLKCRYATQREKQMKLYPDGFVCVTMYSANNKFRGAEVRK